MKMPGQKLKLKKGVLFMWLKYEKRYHENCIVPKRNIEISDEQVKEELYRADMLTDSNIEKLSNGDALDLGDFSIITIRCVEHDEVQGILDQYREEFEEWLKRKYKKNVFNWWTVSEYPEDVTE